MKTFWLILCFCVSFVATPAYATNAIPCEERVTGDSDMVALFCAGEDLDYWNGALDYYEKTGVYPDHEACKAWPHIEFRTYADIKRGCNQSPATGRDLHSCGDEQDSGEYLIVISHQSHLTAISRWYRSIQLQKFFHWCTGAEGHWPWYDVPREWA